jgi:methyl-accepting chemotaxis protein
LKRITQLHRDALRRATSQRIVVLLWLHVPALALLPFAMGSAWNLWLPLIAIVLAGIGSLAVKAGPDRTSAHLAAGVALVGMSGLSAQLLAGSGWDAYADLHALALVALLSCYLDWRVTIAATTALLVLHPAMGALGWEAQALSLQRLILLLIVAATSFWFSTYIERTIAAVNVSIAEAEAKALREEAELRLASEVATDLAAQAAEERLALDFQSEVGSLVGDANNAAQGVRNAVAQISGVAQGTLKRTVVIATASEETHGSAQSLATSVDQLAASISKVSREVREVSDASFKAMEGAGATNETVRQLSDSASRIEDVVKAINKIAAQTKSVALNATIEAARAGEAGRGFAVVANEVKELATQTAKATVDIEREIASIRTDMASAMGAIDEMASTVAQLGGITVSVAGSMDEQAEIAREIVVGATRAAEATESVVSNLRSLVRDAEQGEAAAVEGSRDADLLAQKCGAVESSVRDFVRTLLAA